MPTFISSKKSLRAIAFLLVATLSVSCGEGTVTLSSAPQLTRDKTSIVPDVGADLTATTSAPTEQAQTSASSQVAIKVSAPQQKSRTAQISDRQLQLRTLSKSRLRYPKPPSSEELPSLVVRMKQGQEPANAFSRKNISVKGIRGIHPVDRLLFGTKRDLKRKFRGNSIALAGKSYKDADSIPKSELLKVAEASASLPTKKLTRSYSVTLTAGVSFQEAMRSLRSDPAIESVELDKPVYLNTLPNDPYFFSSSQGDHRSKGAWGQGYENLWGLSLLEAPRAWDLVSGEGVVVAVVDSGVDYTHPDLAPNMWVNALELNGSPGVDDDGNGFVDDIYGYNFRNRNGNPIDSYGHGTHVAGIIAAVGNNSVGIVGVAPKARIMAVKGLDESGAESDLAQAIIYAADNGARIINNSWGGFGQSQVVEAAIEHAHSKGCIVLAAAGNDDGETADYFPANIDNVITVAATTQADEKCGFSNFGLRVDVSAPGCGNVGELGQGAADMYNILSTMPDTSFLGYMGALKVGNGYWRLAGTSMACPYAAGVAALIAQRYPDASSQEIQARLRSSTDSIESKNTKYPGTLGNGRVNAYKAVSNELQFDVKIEDIAVTDAWPGRDTKIAVYLKSYGKKVYGIEAVLSADHPGVSIVNDRINLGDLEIGQRSNNAANPFRLSLDPSVQGASVPLTLTVTSQDGDQIVKSFGIEVRGFQNVGKSTSLPMDDWLVLSTLMFDYDNDGFSDVLVCSGAAKLFKNNQNGSYTDVTTSAKILARNSAVAVPLDFDKNGYQDLLVISIEGGAQLLQNNNGVDFKDVTASSGIASIVSNSQFALYSAAPIDFDGDGYIDIYAPPFLLKNNGNGTFSNATAQSGLLAFDSFSSQILSFDYDNDGKQDIYISGTADGMFSSLSGNLFRNNGNGNFSNVTQQAFGFSVDPYPQAAAVGDFDNDGYTDLYVGGYAWRESFPPKLYKNNGNGTFSDRTSSVGPIGNPLSASWGTQFLDYNNDGHLDLLVVPMDFDKSLRIYTNNGNGTFSDSTETLLPPRFSQVFPFPSVGDAHGDGSLDIYSPAWQSGGFLKNFAGSNGNWFGVRLVGTESNRDGYGAKIRLTAGGRTQLREVHYTFRDNLPIHFGLGTSNSVEKIEVIWPNGKTQTVVPSGINKVLTVTEVGPIYGDVNGNGLLQSSDSTLVNRYLAGTQTFTDGQKKLADVTKNGSITLLDIDYMRKAIGQLATLPVVNRAPVLTSPGSKSTTVGMVLNWQIAATDPDSNPILFSAVIPSSMSGATFDTVTGRLSWTASPNQVGTHQISFQVSDYEMSDTKSGTIVVSPSN